MGASAGATHGDLPSSDTAGSSSYSRHEGLVKHSALPFLRAVSLQVGFWSPTVAPRLRRPRGQSAHPRAPCAPECTGRLRIRGRRVSPAHDQPARPSCSRREVAGRPVRAIVCRRHRRAMVSRSPRPAGSCGLTTPTNSGRIAARWHGRYPRCAKREDASSA